MDGRPGDGGNALPRRAPAIDHLVGDAVLAHDVQEVLVVDHHLRVLPPQPEPLRRLPPVERRMTKTKLPCLLV